MRELPARDAKGAKTRATLPQGVQPLADTVSRRERRLFKAKSRPVLHLLCLLVGSLSSAFSQRREHRCSCPGRAHDVVRRRILRRFRAEARSKPIFSRASLSRANATEGKSVSPEVYVGQLVILHVAELVRHLFYFGALLTQVPPSSRHLSIIREWRKTTPPSPDENVDGERRDCDGRVGEPVLPFSVRQRQARRGGLLRAREPT